MWLSEDQLGGLERPRFLDPILRYSDLAGRAGGIENS